MRRQKTGILGTLFRSRAKCGMDTDKKRVEQPREKWIVIDGQYEELVSQKVFKRTNDNLLGLDVSGRKTSRRNLFFVCGHCGKGPRFSAFFNDRDLRQPIFISPFTHSIKNWY